MGMAAQLMISVSADIQAATKEMANLSKQMEGVSQSVKGADDSLKKVISGAGNVSGALDDTAKAAGRYVDAAGRLREANGRFVKTSGEAADAAGRAGTSFKTLVSAELAADAIKAAGAAMFDTAKASLQLAGELEQSKVAFTTMLGSAEKADAFLKELATFAANTPFELKGLQESSKKLLAFGFDSRDIIPIMTSLGNAVAGLGGGAAEVNRVTMALGQMSAKGKVSAEEMMQLAELGIPAWDMLAKSIGVSVPEAMKMAEKGAIPAAKAIEGLVNGMNERFPNMMANQSKTLLGAWSNLQDGITQTLTNIGTEMIKAFNLTPIIANVAGAVAEFGREIERSGIAGALNKAFSPELKAAILGVGVALTAAMIPALGTAAAALGTWVVAAAPFIATAAAIAFAVQPIIKNWDALVQEFQAIFNGIAVMAGDLYNAFKTVFGKVGELVQGVLKFLAEKLKPVWDVLPEGIKKAIGSIGSAVVQLPGVVVPAIRNMAGQVGNVTLSMSKTAFSPLWDAVEGTQGFFANMTKAIPTMTQGMSGKVALHMKDVGGAATKASKEAETAAKHIAKVMTELPRKLEAIDLSKALALGDTKTIQTAITSVKSALVDLMKNGLSKASPDVKKLASMLDKLTAALRDAKERAEEMKRGTKALEDFTKKLHVITDLKDEITTVESTFRLMGDAVDRNADKAAAYQKAAKALMAQGLDPLNPVIQGLLGKMAEFNKAADDAKVLQNLNKDLADTAKALETVDAKVAVWGPSFDGGAEKVKILEGAINKLLEDGMNPANEEIARLRKEIDKIKTPSAKVAEWLKGVEDKTSDLLNAIKGLKDGLGTLAEELGIKMEGPAGDFIEKIGKISGAVFQVGISLNTLWATFGAPLVTWLTGPAAMAVGGFIEALGGVAGIAATVTGAVASFAVGLGAVALGFLQVVTIAANLLETWEMVKGYLIPIWEGLVWSFQTNLQTMAALVAPIMAAIQASLTLTWTAISSVLAPIWDGLKVAGVAAFQAIADALSFMAPTVASVWDVIAGSIKSNLNTIIGAINFLIRGLNRIKIKVPDWVPNIGGMGWNGPQIGEIPMLAKGGLVDSPTLAVIGEGPHKEAALPLSPSVFSQLASGIVGQMPSMAYAGGGGGDTYISIQVSGAGGGKDWEEQVAERLVKALARKGIKPR